MAASVAVHMSESPIVAEGQHMLQVGCQETSARVSVTRVGDTAAECSETAMAGTAGR